MLEISQIEKLDVNAIDAYSFEICDLAADVTLVADQAREFG
jgi:hypothetical protein